MKNIFLISSILLQLANHANLFAQAASTNPYREGLSKAPLTQQEVETLQEFLNTSYNNLKSALEAARGKTFAEANSIYLETIKSVVIESYKSKPRTEVLMRYALNQALEATFGVPTPDGRGIESPGILINIKNQELLTVILEDSIKLAMNYYTEDLEAVKSGNLLNLPYIQFAADRLKLAKSWTASIFEWNAIYDLSIESLIHWDAIVRIEDELTPNLAKSLERVSKVRQEYQMGRRYADPQEMIAHIRNLRKVLYEVLKETNSAAEKIKITNKDKIEKLKFEKEKMARLEKFNRARSPEARADIRKKANDFLEITKLTTDAGAVNIRIQEFAKEHNEFLTAEIIGELIAALHETGCNTCGTGKVTISSKIADLYFLTRLQEPDVSAEELCQVAGFDLSPENNNINIRKLFFAWNNPNIRGHPITKSELQIMLTSLRKTGCNTCESGKDTISGRMIRDWQQAEK